MDKKDKLFGSDDEDDLDYQPEALSSGSNTVETPSPIPAAP